MKKSKRLKERVSIQRLAEARGVKLARHGADLIGLCPFRDDHEPSLVVSPKKNLWHCLGACSAGGSPIDWVMTAEGVNFLHSVLRHGPLRYSDLTHPTWIVCPDMAAEVQDGICVQTRRSVAGCGGSLPMDRRLT